MLMKLWLHQFKYIGYPFNPYPSPPTWYVVTRWYFLYFLTLHNFWKVLWLHSGSVFLYDTHFQIEYIIPKAYHKPCWRHIPNLALTLGLHLCSILHGGYTPLSIPYFGVQQEEGNLIGPHKVKINGKVG